MSIVVSSSAYDQSSPGGGRIPGYGEAVGVTVGSRELASGQRFQGSVVVDGYGSGFAGNMRSVFSLAAEGENPGVDRRFGLIFDVVADE